MTNAELIAKIKAEIDKRYAEYREKMKSDDFTYYEGMADALDLFEQFIDILESEKPVPNDLEEAAKRFVGYDMDCDELRDYEIGIASFIAGAKWQAEQLLKSSPLPEDTVLFNKGVEEGKRLMMEEAVCYIAQADITATGNIVIPFIRIGYTALSRYGIKVGDKVRIIIIKEDKK